MRYHEIPRPVRVAATLVAINMLVFTLLRVIFLMAFNTPADPLGALLWKSLYTGFKFDLRLAVLINLPLLFSALPGINLYSKKTGKVFWGVYLALANMLVVLVYVFDFGHYAYLGIRIDATALRFALNPLISLGMIWETYPVIPIVLGVTAFIGAYCVLMVRILLKAKGALVIEVSRKKRAAIYALVVFLSLAAIYGKFSYYPLRWSDAFFSTHPFSSALASNPAIYFFETLKKRKGKPFDTELVKKYYPLISEYLNVDNPDIENLSFKREFTPKGKNKKTPNVVIVLLESFAFYKLGVFDNPIDPTPNFDALSKDGILYSRFYTPHSGTARSVFTTITGLPDVETNRTASRNPMVVRQHTIINEYKDHDKFYLLGGSLNWANIRGLLMRNIDDLNLYEEGSYTAPRVDVWGISDLHLFEEANKILRERKDPFIAIIQTSGNHRPYTIPEDNRGFVIRDDDEKTVKEAGFESLEEFNSFRYMDHSIGFFIEQAKKEDYFKDTIFVFYGDHGIPGHALHMPKAELQLSLTTFHVPLLIYAPGRVKGGVIDTKPASEVDVMATVASIADIPYINNTLGRNLLDPKNDNKRLAFKISHNPAMPNIGVISEDYFLTINADGTNLKLHEYHSDNPREDVSKKYPDTASTLSEYAIGLHETAKYLLYHNKPEDIR
jgi:phosphoglycerol transferase MdoB-like AlkP superfamily enzyme